MLSYNELVDLSVSLEGELQNIDIGLVDYLPLVRMHLYMSQRSTGYGNFGTAVPRRSIGGRVKISLRSISRVVSAARRGLSCEQLFVAPALHRNVSGANGCASKHLDSLVSCFGQKNDCVWEFAPSPQGLEMQPCLADRVVRVSRLVNAVRPTGKRVKQILQTIRDILQRIPVVPDWDLHDLERTLSLFEIQRRIYARIFKRSRLKRAYIVCYYGAIQLPIMAALNDQHIEAIEYQHGIQSNVQPMYTRWEHLNRKPATMPGKMLLWDSVSMSRILHWGRGLGLQAQQTGNLWYSANGYAPAEKPVATSILVALQGFPDFFNFDVLHAMEKTRDLEWVFREHPIAILSDEQKEEICKYNRDLKIVGAGDESLEASIERCSICITGFSTVGLEALMCNRTTVFTHLNAKEGLGEYIDGKRCFYAACQSDLLGIIQSA